jgi:glycosyltransferase involved in cell wall biosynthesis
LLIGDGSERSRLEEQSSSLRGDKILFLETTSRDEIAEYLRVTDIFVLCSRNENHPISLKEAIACGTYSIAPAIGRIPYLIEESKCGETYSPNDQETLNKTLLRAIEEKRHVRDRKVGGLHVIVNTWEQNAREIISFVDSINSS